MASKFFSFVVPARQKLQNLCGDLSRDWSLLGKFSDRTSPDKQTMRKGYAEVPDATTPDKKQGIPPHSIGISPQKLLGHDSWACLSSLGEIAPALSNSPCQRTTSGKYPHGKKVVAPNPPVAKDAQTGTRAPHLNTNKAPKTEKRSRTIRVLKGSERSCMDWQSHWVVTKSPGLHFVSWD
ncbi:hypothetical protein GWK47_049780 [Chionoecetes opilio]|uniref:Uncharacterized protein n=1 Tax=Chionoecetes opilio TaxID=41210 RepID=A0A8J4Y215_CHIOP|nr:hypothetical protein GWK47_049780 [Chionoecetes opilio]